jgi:DNA mismatch repair ATPase MutS
LPPGKCVPNDLRLGPETRVLIVSGSNMSGKSTFLRSVGTAVVMALAGAPVRAARLRLSPLALGAVLRVQDSLRDGASRFYAELLALRRVVERCGGPRPVLFLLDEILSGTNSHDRRIGAEALLRRLLARGAIGLVTTHDLALTSIADELAPRARNAHFEDQIQGGVLHFDYRLRDGVIARGNALALMRAVGLDFAEPQG